MLARLKLALNILFRHCRACHGTGVVWERDAFGVMLGYPCFECINKGHCPRCNKPLIFDVEKETCECPHCGWKDEGEVDD